jgi:hypothetical protein
MLQNQSALCSAGGVAGGHRGPTGVFTDGAKIVATRVTTGNKWQ